MATPVPLRTDPLPPAGRPRFANRHTLCPHCLKPCDLAAQDILSFHPSWLDPWDTLRAYDGFYHRACFYQLGDYPRLVTAWQQGEQEQRGKSIADTWAFERDFALLERTTGGPLTLCLFPRYAAWEFADRKSLDSFRDLLQSYVTAPDRQGVLLRRDGLEMRPVADQPLMVVRWAIPLELHLRWKLTEAEAMRPWLGPRRRLPWQKPPAIDLGLAALPQGAVMDVRGGQLEPEADWNLAAITGQVVGWQQESDGAVSATVQSQRLRFVPVWDEEAEGLLRLLDGVRDRLSQWRER